MNHDDWKDLFLALMNCIGRLTEQVDKSMEELDRRLFNIEDGLTGIARRLEKKND